MSDEQKNELNDHFLIAVKYSNIEDVKRYLSLGACANIWTSVYEYDDISCHYDRDSERIITIAAKNNNIEIVKLLLKAGAVIEIDEIAITIDNVNFKIFQLFLNHIDKNKLEKSTYYKLFCRVKKMKNPSDVLLFAQFLLDKCNFDINELSYDSLLDNTDNEKLKEYLKSKGAKTEEELKAERNRKTEELYLKEINKETRGHFSQLQLDQHLKHHLWYGNLFPAQLYVNLGADVNYKCKTFYTYEGCSSCGADEHEMDLLEFEIHFKTNIDFLLKNNAKVKDNHIQQALSWTKPDLELIERLKRLKKEEETK